MKAGRRRKFSKKKRLMWKAVLRLNREICDYFLLLERIAHE